MYPSAKDDVDDPTGDFKKIYKMLSTNPFASITKPALFLASSNEGDIIESSLLLDEGAVVIAR